jgi:hypothetical protein
LFFAVLYAAFFAPATFSRQFLAPGDGRLYYMPHFGTPFTLWNPDSMTGYPSFADPQEMKWYAPALLLSQIPGSWNVFVILAYVLASWFTYLYGRALTGDGFAGLAGGVFFGMSGFLMAHLGHSTIIHAAAWTPCLLWVFEELWRAIRVRWVLVGGFAAAQCILAGHPQIALYGLTLASAYAVFRMLSLRRERILYACATGSVLVLAVMLSSIQMISTATLAQMTPRVKMDLAIFGSYSVAPYQLAALVFPCLFGGAGAFTLDHIPDLAEWGVTETAGYVGFSALVLMVIGLVARRRELVTYFWAAAGLIALLASMGTFTPFGHMVYLLPGFGQFRAQGRFIFIFCLAAAVLAALGLRAIRQKSTSVQNAALALIAMAVLIASALLMGPLAGHRLQAVAAFHGLAHFPVSISGNRWIAIPVVSGVLLTALLLTFMQRPAAWWTRGALLAGLICELGTFGWYAEWRIVSSKLSDVQPPPSATKDIAKLHEAGGRWLAVRGYLGSTREMPPDLASLWGVPSVAKYGPLLPVRFRDLLDIETNGLMLGRWWDSRNRALDIVGARLVADAPEQVPGTEVLQGVTFPLGDLDLSAGHECGAAAPDNRIVFPHAKRAAFVGIVSLMGCSTSIAQGTPVLEMHFVGAKDSAAATRTLRAGVDTAEWAAACDDVAPAIRHKPAQVFSRFSVPRGAATCQGQRYFSFLQLPNTMDVKAMDFRWLPAGSGITRLVSIVFVDEKGHSDPVTTADVRIGDPTRWKQFGQDAGVSVYENLRSMSRAWLTWETVTLNPDDVKRTIRTSKLPDGRDYDPAVMALIEAPLGFQSPARDPNARVWIVDDRKTVLDLQTFNRQAAFLVLGDFYYPGWRANVNGQPTRIFRTNYIQRGILVPAGQNFIRFEFHPADLYTGAAVSGSGILLCLAVALAARQRGVL